MNKCRQATDIQLIHMLHERDAAPAFEEIYNRYWGKLYSSAYKRLKSQTVAEEIVQDVFTDIWERREDLTIKNDLAVYLFSAIKYRTINYIHKEIVKNKYASERFNILPQFDNSTEDKIIANDLNHHLEDEVQSLPMRCREVYELSRYSHQSNKEIAFQLGISEKTVENQITKALRRLRTSLNFFFLF